VYVHQTDVAWSASPPDMEHLYINQFHNETFEPGQKHDGSARIVNKSLVMGNHFSALRLISSSRRVSASDRSPDIELNKEISATVDHMTMFGRPLCRLYVSQPYENLRGFV